MKYLACFLWLFFWSCKPATTINQKEKKNLIHNNNTKNMEEVIFAGGCFWCTEAVFLEINGVEKVEAGYIGGNTENPDYKSICTGETGHAEAIKIYYDTTKVTFLELLEIFFLTHDPTTLNKQGNDVGTQYRSAIFYSDENEKSTALEIINSINQQKLYPNDIVTTLEPQITFYIAEDYHQNYYNNNPNQGYCAYVIQPKMEKFRKIFKDKLK